MTTEPATSSAPRDRKETIRTVAALAVAALIVLFAVLNLDEVKVNWIVGTWTTPLIVVIGVTFVLGIGSGLLIARGRARRRR